jgi:DNA primase
VRLTLNLSRNSDFFQEIKEKNDIVSVISEYVSLKRSGRSLLGLCPFHNEKTASFNVNQAKQFFYCFGCGAGGDVFSFIMKIENLEFIDAAKSLAERAGISWPELTKDSEKNRRKDVYYKINQLAAALYSHFLFKTELGNKARQYLTERGINTKFWKEFNLGYAPPSWHNLADVIRKKGLPLQHAEALGLIAMGENGYYDRFRDRIIFPITDSRGKIVGFGGRVMGQGEPKYLNSSDNILFHKGQFLYGLSCSIDSIRRTKRAIIVEGYMDVIQAHQGGLTNTVASLGTSLTREQAKLIKRFTSEVILAYDADTAGQNATLRGMEILEGTGLTVRVLNLPTGFDPDSFIKEKGVADFEEIIENAPGLVEYKIETVFSKHDLSSFQGKSQAVEELLPYLLTIESNVAREHYIRQIARKTGFSENAILLELGKYRKHNREKTPFLDRKSETSYTNQINFKLSDSTVARAQPNSLSPLQKAIFLAEKELLQLALQEYDKLKRIIEELKPEEFSFEIWRNLFLKVKEISFSTDNMEAVLNELGSGEREIAASIIAEREAKDLTIDFDQIISYIRVLHLKEKIESLTLQITTGCDQFGQVLTEDQIKSFMAQITELNRTLKKDHPHFSGL